jgi:hydroxymethylglutaryl-CoA lyase
MFKTLPSRIEVAEVGPRDGFQNVKTFIATQDKIAIIDSLIAAGLKQVEVSSFVSPKAIPQMADAGEVCRAIIGRYGNRINATALVPNLRGAELARDAGIRSINCVISVSEAHNKANINRTHEESLAELHKILDVLPELSVTVGLATVFACPFTGWIDPGQVVDMIGKVAAFGVKKMVLCDTIGVATPDRVYAVSRLAGETFPHIKLSLHLHDTRGMGLVNTVAGMMAGITSFETSVGGLGGCPFAPGAAGNTATEDMVNMLEGMKIETGVDLAKLLATVKIVEDKVDAALTSHMAKAKIYECCGSTL